MTSKIPEGVHLYLKSELDRGTTQSIQKTVDQLYRNVTQPKGSAHQQLQLYRRLVPELIHWMLAKQKLTDNALQSVKRMEGESLARSGKRWTPEEDEALVEMASRDGVTLISLSTHFGRTPGAITSRLTYLVGIRQVSRHIAGRLIGYLDGEPVEGHFEGEVAS